MQEKTNAYLDFIKSRKSVRKFIFQKIQDNIIREIIECGRWAPSGLNNQPWKVCVVSHPTIKRMLAELTKYGGIIESAFVNLIVFYDIDRGYDRTKDIQACGAFMENLLLGVHAFPNIGAVWIGEILNQKAKVNEIFKLRVEKFELMGVIAIGIIDEIQENKSKKARERRPLDDFISWY
ncbi:MAG: nitroreductase family protein [Promethearchaeota archaeon]